jgi:hypothetical protein
MKRGRNSAKLTAEQVEAFERIQKAHRLSLPRLAKFLELPFDWRTLGRALDGKSIWTMNHEYLVAWLHQHAQKNGTAQTGETVTAGRSVPRR